MQSASSLEEEDLISLLVVEQQAFLEPVVPPQRTIHLVCVIVNDDHSSEKSTTPIIRHGLDSLFGIKANRCGDTEKLRQRGRETRKGSTTLLSGRRFEDVRSRVTVGH